MIRVRAAAVATLLVLIGPSSAFAQKIFGEGGILKDLASAYNIDFAIPESPAFKILDVDPSSILRPGTPQQLALNFSQFRTEDGDFRLPSSFAVEFSPALLIAGGDLKLESYEARKLLYATRISIATRGDTLANSPRSISFGVRLGIKNEADLRLDPDFTSGPEVTNLTREIVQVYSNARDRVGPTGTLVLNQDEKDQIEALEERIRDIWAERHWNATAMDLALAVRAETMNEAGENPEILEVRSWATYSKGYGNWGQLLMGAQLGIERETPDDDFKQEIVLALRGYVGSNHHKVFLEMQDALQEGGKPDFLFNTGAEVRVSNWIWATFSLGAQRIGADDTFSTVTSFKLHTVFQGP